MTERQILAQVPTPSTCEDSEDTMFAIAKLNRLSPDVANEAKHYPQLFKRRQMLEAKQAKHFAAHN